MITVASLVPGNCLDVSVSAGSYRHWVSLHGDGYNPNPFGLPGIEKSSI